VVSRNVWKNRVTTLSIFCFLLIVVICLKIIGLRQEHQAFLVKLFKQERYNLAKFENLEVNEDLINSFDIDNISLETVMFQSGYLTIGKVTNKRRRFIYQLQYPNFETR